MTILNLKVNCFRCRKEVSKSEVREVPSINPDKRYECSSCYNKYKREPILAGMEAPAIKKEFLCVRCNYHFKSKIQVCPLCSKSDYLTGGVVTVKDLL